MATNPDTMKEFAIFPYLGRKVNVSQDDESLFIPITEGMARTHDVGGVNFDLNIKRDTCTKSKGYVSYGDSITAKEDYTTYTENDSNGRFAVTANKITVTGLAKNEDANIYYDFGADYFSGDFTHELGPINVNSSSLGGLTVVWMLANEIDDWLGLATGGKDHLCVYVSDSLSILTIGLYSGDADTAESDSSTGLSVDTDYYLKIVRGGTDLDCYIYTDATMSLLADQLSLPSLEQGLLSYRYLFAVNSYNQGFGADTDMTTENLKLG